MSKTIFTFFLKIYQIKVITKLYVSDPQIDTQVFANKFIHNQENTENTTFPIEIAKRFKNCLTSNSKLIALL